MSKHLVAVLFIAVSMASSNAQQPSTKIESVPIKRTSVTSGKQMYQSYCAVCHGVSGVGNGSAAPALKMPPANLTLLSSKNNGVFPGDHVAAVLRFGSANPAHGSAEMPIWSDLFSTIGSHDQASLRVANITDYLKTLQKK